MDLCLRITCREIARYMSYSFYKKLRMSTSEVGKNEPRNVASGSVQKSILYVCCVHTNQNGMQYASIKVSAQLASIGL
jgi:hypothetical protein